VDDADVVQDGKTFIGLTTLKEVHAMKSTLSLILQTLCAIVLGGSVNAWSQPGGYKDRLARVRDMVNSDELIMIWSQGPTFNAHALYQRVFDLDLTRPGGVDSTLVRKPLEIDSAIVQNERLAVATGNFLGGKYKNIVSAWEGEGNAIRVTIPHIDPGTLSWTDASRLSVPGLAPFGSKKKIHLVTGDFFGDRQDEFVLGYEGADTTIHLQVFSFNPGDLTPQPRGSINDEHAMPPGSNLDNWDIVSGDFDGDGYHDIALLFVKPLSASNWSLYAKIYTVDDQGTLVPKASQAIFPRPAYAVTDVNIAGASGSFDQDAALEVAFGFCFFQGEQSGPDTYVYLLDVRNGLNTIAANDSSRISRDVVGPNEMTPLDVGSGDLNNDGRDEVILMSGSTFFVYSVNDHLVPQYKAQQSIPATGSSDHSDAFLSVGDLDADRHGEIVAAQSFPGAGDPGDMQHFNLEVFSMDSLLSTFTLKARRLQEFPVLESTGARHFAIALGDLDGDRMRLGPPVHFRRTGVVQPTVILYSPPTHFDILDTGITDLSGCYPGQSCGFSSTYIQSTSFDTTVTTETHEDWGGDATIRSAQFIFQEKVKATYGDKFSRSAGSSRSMTITTGRIAAGDDWIYANVYDIDFYEYPVLDSHDAVLGHFLVSIPGIPRPLWIEGKDDDVIGNLFRPDHEVGNILSYRMDNTADTARVIVNFPEQTVGSTGSSFASLQISSFRENSIDSSWDAGAEVGATIDAMGDVSGFEVGVEIEVNGHYNYGEIYTQTVNVGNSLELRGDLSHLQPQYGTSGTYYVKPYAYWTSYGALALDYKVSPLPVGGNSFWQLKYGSRPDLAFSLPWRYDPEKGSPLPGNDTTYRFRTRDIVLSKPAPRGGDTITIGARVRNLGLQSVTTPVTVRFYRGDPATGGTQIAEALIDTVIPPRSARNVFAHWAVPLADTLRSVRIYALIDPDNSITNEVHENNNKGWAPGFAYGGTLTGIQPGGEVPQAIVLYPAYPNPFNPMTTITFDLPYTAHVSLKVYNVLGQEVVTLADEVRNAGTHRIHFNAAGLASSVYFYRLDVTAQDGARARQSVMGKVLLLK
jgi:Secretion system C-terminal sorting domain/CARDB